MDPKPLVAITLGDPSGIGPEVTARALSLSAVRETLIPVVYGDEEVWRRACKQVGVADRLKRASKVGEVFAAPSGQLITVSSLSEEEARPGRPTLAGGRAQLAYLIQAIEELQREGSSLEALCTAPLSKAQVHRAGQAFSGHTELLAERFGSRVLMLLAGPVLRVAVHTTHVALARVPGLVAGQELVRDLELMHRELTASFGIAGPRIAVCALNPHAGEEGLFGDEEGRILVPAISEAVDKGITVSGPFPADGLFPRAAKGEFDAVLAMYHDQGLIPFKMFHFDEGVNVTLGLPIPRTSPDHGVAYDLAGKGLARSQSMEAALILAAKLARGRRKNT